MPKEYELAERCLDLKAHKFNELLLSHLDSGSNWSCLPTPEGDSYLDGPGDGFLTFGENPGCNTSPIFSRSQVPMEKPGDVGRIEMTCLPIDEGDKYVPGPIFIVVAEVVSCIVGLSPNENRGADFLVFSMEGPMVP